MKSLKPNPTKVFFEKLLKKNDFVIYWNKVYEPDYLKFDEQIQKTLRSKNIHYKICKGNVLNEINEINKK